MLKPLLAQVKEFKRASILTPVFVVLEVVMELAIPMMMASIIDNGVDKGDMAHVARIGAIMACMALLSLAFGVAAGRLAARASSGFARNLRRSMFANIQTFAFSNLDKYSTSGLITRMTTDVTNVQNAYQMILRMCVRAPSMLVCALFMAFSINAKLSLVFLAAIPFLALCLVFITKNAHAAFLQVFRRYADLNASVQENLSAIRVVKSYVREDHEVNKFQSACNQVYRLFVKAERTLAFNAPVMQFTVYGCILLLSWLGAKSIVAGGLTTGQLMSLFSYVMNILMSLMMLSMVFVMITMARASADRIAEVLQETPDLKEDPQPLTQAKDGGICFDHVTMRYHAGGKPALRDINLQIAPGETLGVVGGTGSSKSTLVQLIPRLYDAAEGKILVGGQDVRRYDLQALRSQVAMVLQKNTLFSGTIRENLLWGNENATQAQLEQACKAAQAHDFICALPQGYDAIIEQGGTNVSGGQRQRLCLARALLKNPKILILDDSTSAVDMRTDSLIRQGLAQTLPDATKIIIAQRISSVQDCDHILVLNNGEASAYGTHEQLLQESPIYQEVYRSQQKGADEQ